MYGFSKYGIRELSRDFPTNKSCLEFVFDAVHDRRCSCGGVFSLRKNRKSFRCGRCKHEIAPLKGTIFEKSSTPLVLWFHAMLLFSNAKSGISAMELKRNLSVTRKCAWRMLSLLRSSLTQGPKKLSGIVEADQTYIGGRSRGKSMGDAFKAKSLAMAVIERHGEVRVKVIENKGKVSTGKFVTEHVERLGTRLMTDEDQGYIDTDKLYETHMVNHEKKEYVRGDVHVNTVESFWAHVKRCLKGTYKSVSKKHVQSYLDAFAFHYNNAHNDRLRFELLLQLVLLSGAKTRTGV